MRRIQATSLLILLLLQNPLSAQTNQNSRPHSLVLTHVTVIDATGSPAKLDMTVVITNDRITTLGKGGRVRIPIGAQVVDATGKFLIPGLWDMHAHTLRRVRAETFFPLFIANGVTGVRDMGTTPEEFRLLKQWRKEIADGTRVGPRIVASGPLLDGANPVYPSLSIVASNEIEGRQAVRSLKQQGADFVKVYNRLSRAAYFAIADEARKQQTSFAGHVPDEVSAREASDAGQKSIEHLSGIVADCSTFEPILKKALAEASASSSERHLIEQALDTCDERKALILFKRLAKNDTWYVPTFVQQKFVEVSQPGADWRLRYVLDSMRADWESEMKSLTPGNLASLKRVLQRKLEVVGVMRRAGVKFLAGTDTPIRYILVPGFSLHDELVLFVRAGLTPMEALQTATRNPAEFLGTLNTLGTVEKGKIADLVLLDADPLADISNTQRIAAVVFGGKLFPKKSLQKMLVEVEAAASKK